MGLFGRAAKVVVRRHPVVSATVALIACAPLVWLTLPSAPPRAEQPTSPEKTTPPPPPPTTVTEYAHPDDLDLAEPLPPRAILGRTWFDKYPDKRRETVQMWFWMGGGIALHESGSSYRISLEIFEFERQNDRLVVTALQDKKTVTTGFRIEPCDEEPFNVCLTLDQSPRGPKKYYGFARRWEQERHAPWATGFEKAAEARAASLPRE
jgi:hypothetical protein